MSAALAAVALVVLAQAEVAPVDAPDEVGAAVAKAIVEGEAGTDLLAANVVNAAPGSGSPEELTALELGLRARLRVTAFAGRGHLDLDYQGRQPIAGTSQNSAIHLLYQAEVSVDLLDRALVLGAGRFLAPSAALLPVDGVRAQLRVWRLKLQVFGGRRAITSTRGGNVEPGTLLPAGGAAVALTLARVEGELAVAFSRDQVPMLRGTTVRSFDAPSAWARVAGRPFDWLAAGAEVATAARASYLLGPNWGSLELGTRTVDLFFAVAFVELRPFASLRLSYGFHFQQAGLFREGLRLDPSDPRVAAEGFTPQFLDQRVRLRWRPLGLGWLSPEARLRIRPDWQEWRLGGTADLAPDWAYGLCLRGGFSYEKMVQNGAALAPADRSYWSASLAWRWRGLDLAVGASNVRRIAAPLSGREYTRADDGPGTPVDLSPFVLEAQRLFFARAFYGSDLWFAGLDFEQSLTDGRERRVFAQLGARLEKEW